MTMMILGLFLFLGVHSVRIVAEDLRSQAIRRFGFNAWKGAYTVLSLIGFVLLIRGYGMSRITSPLLYDPPRWLYHVTALLMWISFVLLAAAYVRGNRIKAAIGHPMVAGVKLWSLAHLLSNGRASDVILFGAFLVWSIVDFASARRRDRAAGTIYPATGAARDGMVLAAGTVAYLVFALWLHGWLIGVDPFAA